MGRARQAFLMHLKPGTEVEYQRRHDEIWPELGELLRVYGIGNYSIFRHGLDLFAYLEAEDLDRLAHLPAEPLMQRWWLAMEDLMDTNPDHSPVQVMLPEVFHLD